MCTSSSILIYMEEALPVLHLCLWSFIEHLTPLIINEDEANPMPSPPESICIFQYFFSQWIFQHYLVGLYIAESLNCKVENSVHLYLKQ